MNKPKERYVIDITYLPFEIYKNSKFRYILNCLDHFSKFLFSFLLENKTAKEINDKLKLIFQINGFPEQIGSDNGSEFNNKLVKKLLSDNKIKFIKGKPYNPHSQGTVERVHRTVRNGLICLYL